MRVMYHLFSEFELYLFVSLFKLVCSESNYMRTTCDQYPNTGVSN